MNLNTKIKNKEIKVFIAGCGYTGYPLAKLISKNRIIFYTSHFKEDEEISNKSIDLNKIS